MPIYLWRCDKCGHEQEQECRVHELPTFTLYCTCGKPMKRIIAPTVFGNASEIKKQREAGK